MRQLIARIRSNPAGAPAVEQGDRTITYGDLSLLVASRARLLAGSGVGQVSAVHRRKSIEYLIDLLAVLDTGGVAVPIDPDLPKGRRDTFVKLARPTQMVDESGVRKLETEPWQG